MRKKSQPLTALPVVNNEKQTTCEKTLKSTVDLRYVTSLKFHHGHHGYFSPGRTLRNLPGHGFKHRARRCTSKPRGNQFQISCPEIQTLSKVNKCIKSSQWFQSWHPEDVLNRWGSGVHINYRLRTLKQLSKSTAELYPLLVAFRTCPQRCQRERIQKQH